LGTLILEAAEEWDNASRHAPAPKVAQMIVDFEIAPAQRKADEQRAQRMRLEAGSGRVGLDKCEEALERLNELDRTL
jgi:hypothetical protein